MPTAWNLLRLHEWVSMPQPVLSHFVVQWHLLTLVVIHYTAEMKERSQLRASFWDSGRKGHDTGKLALQDQDGWIQVLRGWGWEGTEGIRRNKVKVQRQRSRWTTAYNGAKSAVMVVVVGFQGASDLKQGSPLKSNLSGRPSPLLYFTPTYSQPVKGQLSVSFHFFFKGLPGERADL